LLDHQPILEAQCLKSTFHKVIQPLEQGEKQFWPMRSNLRQAFAQILRFDWPAIER
jgi:hypothetical protein